MSMIQRAVNKRQGVNLLSADGGGVQGLAALVTLREFMRRIQAKLGLSITPRPCEYFDLMAGTGIGGLIVIMLGRLCMSVDEAIDWFNEIVTQVFDNKKLWGNGAFKATIFEKFVERMVAKHIGSATAPMIDPQAGEEVCKTVVCAMSAHSMIGTLPTLFRSYESVKNRAPDCTVVQAARATTAKPGIFKPVEIEDHGIKLSYVDGGLGCNNPTSRMLDEAEVVFPGQHAQSIISLGTGQTHPSRVPTPGLLQRVLPTQAAKAMEKIATDCERTSQEIATRFRHVPGVYFRFNVDQGLQDTQHSDFDKLPEVAAHAMSHHQKADVDLMLGQATTATIEGKEMVATEHLSGAIQRATIRRRLKICPAPSVLFTGRLDVIAQMEEHIFDGSSVRHVFVLHGLGGCGKTQTALKFLEKNRNCFSDILYINASSATTVSAYLRSLATFKKGQTEDDALAWLAQHDTNWLMLFDSADDTSLQLQQYFPACSHGTILITTRNHQMINLASRPHAHYKVSGMSPQDARELLITASSVRITKATEEHSDILTLELGYLALAIIQAGAYIRVNECTLQEYLEMYHKNKLLLEEYRKISPRLDDYDQTVYTTWLVSYKQLRPKVIGFLHLLAFMHHDGISEDIFYSACQHQEGSMPKPELSLMDAEDQVTYQSTLGLLKDCFLTTNGDYDKCAFLDIIRELRSYSLVDFDPLNRVYSIHSLVQDWTRSIIPNSEAAHRCTATLLALSLNPYAESVPPMFHQNMLLPHIDAVLVNFQAMTFTAEVFALAYRDAGRLREAETLYHLTLKSHQSRHGEESISTLDIMDRLASIYAEQGRHEESEALQLQVLESRERVLGKYYPDTLASFSNLAMTYSRQGRFQEAEALQKESLHFYIRVLADMDPSALNSRAHLIEIYLYQSRLEEAEELQKRTIEMLELRVGPREQRTLSAMQMLARIHVAQERWEMAEEVQWKVTQARQEALGDDHPETRDSMAALCSLYQNPDSLHQSEARVEVDREKLGKEDPDALRSMHTLALVYFNLGRMVDAERLERAVLDSRRRVLGRDHDDTLASMQALALTYQSLGKQKEAEDLRHEMLVVKSRTLCM